MSHNNQVVIQMNGYKLHVIRTEKYKTNNIVLKMKAPLSKDTVTYRALLSQVLQSSTKNYPTTAQFRTYLEDLYGANFYGSVGKKGEYHILTFYLEIANEKFLSSSEPLLEKGVRLMKEALLQPNASDGAFQTKTVDQEKRTLKQRIQSINDDKMKYSSNRLVEEMCNGEPYSLEVNGLADQVDEITPASLYEYYLHAIDTDEIDVYVVGDVESQMVEGFFKQSIDLSSRSPQEKHKDNREIKVEKVKEIKEVQDISQGKLNIGYRTGIVYGDPQYFTLQVFNGIFGGFPHSKLFAEVREKNSLAYYAASRLESHKGLLIVVSGIQSENYEKTLTIINEQMEAMRRGDFSEAIIAQTKAVIENQLLETLDMSSGLIEVLYHDVIAKTNITIDDWLNEVKKVTKEEIMEVANKVQLDTVYFLSGREVSSS